MDKHACRYQQGVAAYFLPSQELAYHQDQEEYIEAKSSIVKYQHSNDFAVINADYQNSLILGKQSQGKKIYVSREKEVLPGCFVRGSNIVISGTGFSLPIGGLQLRGAHNLENICAATAAAYCAGADFDAIKTAAQKFKGLEHRLEFVADKGGVKLYNDSFSTTPETAVAAIKAFTEPEVLILGGSSKNSDFSGLAKVILAATNIKALILIGQEANRISQAINDQGKFPGLIATSAKNMAQIFTQIKSVAKKGDVVILSPACASFDMFKSYVDRGEQFKREALEW